jgi:hypothetical protein
VGAGHLARHSAFIQVHQAFCGDVAHPLAVSLTFGDNLVPILLDRLERLVSPLI